MPGDPLNIPLYGVATIPAGWGVEMPDAARAVREAVKAERDACVKAVQDAIGDPGEAVTMETAFEKAVEAIRARDRL